MVAEVVGTVLLVLMGAALLTALYAFVHAALQRSDAYTAVNKLTKPVWLIILGMAMLLTCLLYSWGWAIGFSAAGVYLVDVRPKLLEIQGKSR